MRILKGSINVSAIDKKKLISGKKGSYLNVSIIVKDDLDLYGNIGFITQDTTKEEREQGVKGVILGNIKDLPSNKPEKNISSKPSNILPLLSVNDEDDLPF